MISFVNDYSEGAHEKILEALISSNLEQSDGYGLDTYCEQARTLIREKIQAPQADVHFLVGGTQTNQIAIAAFLKPYQAVIAAESGHINVHETGAIEATGHKVLVARSIDGKLTPQTIWEVVALHSDEHMVQPKLVYISNSTEIGTIYKKAEIIALWRFCKEYNLDLYLDGARLASAFCSGENDLTLHDLAQYTDAFYIGGTKNGALFGEALVLVKDSMKTDFRFMIKQQGAMLAKGRLLGLQFLTLFKDDLYFSLARHANTCAMRIKEAFKEANASFLVETTTNQIFPILKDEEVEKLSKEFAFITWEKTDATHTCIRIVTSWATKPAHVEALIQAIKEM